MQQSLNDVNQNINGGLPLLD